VAVLTLLTIPGVAWLAACLPCAGGSGKNRWKKWSSKILFLAWEVSFAVCKGLKLPLGNGAGLRPGVFPPFSLGSVPSVFVDFVVAEIKAADAVA